MYSLILLPCDKSTQWVRWLEPSYMFCSINRLCIKSLKKDQGSRWPICCIHISPINPDITMSKTPTMIYVRYNKHNPKCTSQSKYLFVAFRLHEDSGWTLLPLSERLESAKPPIKLCPRNVAENKSNIDSTIKTLNSIGSSSIRQNRDSWFTYVSLTFFM